ncbi:MAG TPA: dihydroorotate dehydrogenase [Deltaproteobacteria bacterium]|mgnify:CR=1 FL=1|nr:dihydroorotate dehydrogenase [Deltaproteobacteria bacterium]
MKTAVRIREDLELKNPIITASGTAAYGEELSEFLDLSVLGGFVTKGLSIRPKRGNPTPRIAETPCGMINSIGLENVGIPVFLKEKLPYLNQFSTPVVVNFFGETEDDYVIAAEMLSIEGIAALEMNVSCPNIKRGGIEFGKDPESLHTLVKKVREVTKKPLIVKLPPLVTDIVVIARAAVSAGADVLTCCNTFPAMVIDENLRRPLLGNVTGGLSGPAIKPVVLKLVRDVSQSVHVPIIASGGASTYRDVIQFLLAGATAVEIGSESLRNPLCFLEIIKGIEEYMERFRMHSVSEITGTLEIV